MVLVLFLQREATSTRGKSLVGRSAARLACAILAGHCVPERHNFKHMSTSLMMHDVLLPGTRSSHRVRAPARVTLSTNALFASAVFTLPQNLGSVLVGVHRHMPTLICRLPSWFTLSSCAVDQPESACTLPAEECLASVVKRMMGTFNASMTCLLRCWLAAALSHIACQGVPSANWVGECAQT
jgi:hypothetical protein